MVKLKSFFLIIDKELKILVPTVFTHFQLSPCKVFFELSSHSYKRFGIVPTVSILHILPKKKRDPKGAPSEQKKHILRRKDNYRNTNRNEGAPTGCFTIRRHIK